MVMPLHFMRGEMMVIMMEARISLCYGVVGEDNDAASAGESSCCYF